MRRLAAVGVALLLLVTGACGGDSTPVEAKGSTVPSSGGATSTAVPDTLPVLTTTAPPFRNVPLGPSFLIDVGESVDVSGEGLTVTYAELLADSRCPIGVQCVWAGNATISVVLAKPGSPQGTVPLNTMEGPTSGDFAGYTITLVGLNRGSAPAATLTVT